MEHRRRSGFMFGLMAVGVLTSTVVATNSSHAASSNGPYYATPSWDQKLPAATRFVALADWNSEAVLDRETGLVWERSPASSHFGGGVSTAEWSRAVNTCYSSSAVVPGERLGWRLPTVEELASLISPFEQGTVKLPAGHPFIQVIPARYWTATSAPETATVAFWVDFGTAGVSADPKTTQYGVWCVRGSHGHDGR